MKRRKFIELTSMGSAALASSVYFPSRSGDRNLKAGLIGAGWYGMVDIKAALKVGGVEVTGICDVDSDHLSAGAGEIESIQGFRPKTFKYFRDLLEMKELEAVFIATPPHWHALQFIAACEKKLDIYCEKPLAYDIREGIAMTEAAIKSDNIIQIGFQRRQSNAFSKAGELITSGRIGNVHQINAQINYIPAKDDTTIQPPPPALDWNEWCGPAPRLDYKPSIGHKSWRLEKEYGNGHLVDWGIHHIDIIRVIMNEGMPVEFQSSGGLNILKNQITTPDTLTAQMKFNKAPVLWQHRLWGPGNPTKEFNNGILFFGDEGSLFADDSKVIVFSRNNQREEMSLPSPQTQEKHVANFLDAVRNKNKKLISCPPDDAFQSTATVQLAMISYYSDSMVRWDFQRNEITENPKASKLLRREYRSGYIHP